jgi:drug/metabolite transporter (DMT)-like permease
MNRRGWLLFSAMCVIWGIPYLLIRVAVRELDPSVLVFGRTSIAALLLLPIAAARGELRPVVRRWAPLLVFAALEIVVPWYLLSDAETHLTSSLTGILLASIPLLAVVIARFSGDRERVESRRLAGLLLGVVGVAALVGLDLGHLNVFALVEIGLVALCYALGPVVLSRRLADVPALGVTAVSIAVGAVVWAAPAAAQWPSSTPSGRVLASVVALAVVCTAVAFLVFFALIAEVGPARAMVFTYVNPAVAAVLGVALLGEVFTAGMGAGFALVLAGSVLATWREPPRALAPETAAA